MAGSTLLCILPTRYANITMKENVHKLCPQANKRLLVCSLLVCSRMFFCLQTSSLCWVHGVGVSRTRATA